MKLKSKTTATLLIALFMMSALAFVNAADTIVELGVKGDAVAEMSYGNGYPSSGDCAHLKTIGAEFGGDEARVRINMATGTTLDDILSISWKYYLVEGYAPHVDIILDVGGGTDALVFEYAFNDETRLPEGWPNYGSATGGYHTTFSEGGDGPAVIDGDALAWPASMTGALRAPLSEWKDPGITYGSITITGATPVLALEFEVDNWIDQTEAFIDDIEINGVTYDFENTGSFSMDIDVVPAVVSISLDEYSVNFGTVAAGYTASTSVTVTHNGGTVVGAKLEKVTVELMEDTDGFYAANMKVETYGAPYASWSVNLAPNDEEVVDLYLSVPWDYLPGEYTGTLVFWAEAVAP